MNVTSGILFRHIGRRWEKEGVVRGCKECLHAILAQVHSLSHHFTYNIFRLMNDEHAFDTARGQVRCLPLYLETFVLKIFS